MAFWYDRTSPVLDQRASLLKALKSPPPLIQQRTNGYSYTQEICKGAYRNNSSYVQLAIICCLKHSSLSHIVVWGRRIAVWTRYSFEPSDKKKQKLYRAKQSLLTSCFLSVSIFSLKRGKINQVHSKWYRDVPSIAGLAVIGWREDHGGYPKRQESGASITIGIWQQHRWPGTLWWERSEKEALEIFKEKNGSVIIRRRRRGTVRWWRGGRRLFLLVQLFGKRCLFQRVLLLPDSVRRARVQEHQLRVSRRVRQHLLPPRPHLPHTASHVHTRR